MLLSAKEFMIFTFGFRYVKKEDCQKLIKALVTREGLDDMLKDFVRKDNLLSEMESAGLIRDVNSDSESKELPVETPPTKKHKKRTSAASKKTPKSKIKKTH